MVFNTDCYVIDASVVVKWVSEEREASLRNARLVYNMAVRREIRLLAPEWLQAEVANVLLKKKQLKVSNIGKLLEYIAEARIVYMGLSRELLRLALELAEKHDLSVYDGLYMAAAQRMEVKLISADKKGHGGIPGVVILDDLF